MGNEAIKIGNSLYWQVEKTDQTKLYSYGRTRCLVKLISYFF